MGSGIIVGIGNDAKQDAWIAIAIASLFGILLVLFFSQINSRVEGK
jgi:spore germination protein KB